MFAKEHEQFALFGWRTTPFSQTLIYFFVLVSIMYLIRVVYAKTKVKLYFPESALFVVGGIIVGVVIDLANWMGFEDFLEYPPDIFLYIFIPIILLDASYSLNKSVFFTNFIEIVVFAVIGTSLATMFTGLLFMASKSSLKTKLSTSFTLAFAALISSIDPVAIISIMENLNVNIRLFNMTFGESTLNDGPAIVLYHIFMSLDSLSAEGKSSGAIFWLGVSKFFISVIGSIVMAFVVCLVCGQIFRITRILPIVEPVLMMCVCYFCFILSDALLFSGVISIMTSAFIVQFYLIYNIQPESKYSFNEILHGITQLCENLLFLDIGLQIGVTIVDRHNIPIDVSFIFLNIIFILLVRSACVVVQSLCLNLRKNAEKISWQEMIVLIVSGLRGSVSFALARLLANQLCEDSDNEFNADAYNVEFTTAICILFTIIFQALPMTFILKWLKIEQQKAPPKFQQIVLAQPIYFIADFVVLMAQGSQSGFSHLVFLFDRFMQKALLKQPLTQSRELQEIMTQFEVAYKEQTSESYLQKLRENEEDRKLQLEQGIDSNRKTKKKDKKTTDVSAYQRLLGDIENI